jgi:hypothetical protein
MADNEDEAAADRTGVRDDIVDRFEWSVGSLTDAKTGTVAVGLILAVDGEERCYAFSQDDAGRLLAAIQAALNAGSRARA